MTNGSCCLSHAFRSFCPAAGIRHLRTRPYTPRTNGKAERMVQTLLRERVYRFAFRSSAGRGSHAYLHVDNHIALADHSGSVGRSVV